MLRWVPAKGVCWFEAVVRTAGAQAILAAIVQAARQAGILLPGDLIGDDQLVGWLLHEAARRPGITQGGSPHTGGEPGPWVRARAECCRAALTHGRSELRALAPPGQRIS